MKRMMIRALIRNRQEQWTEEFSVKTYDDMTEWDYVVTVINHRNLIARPRQLSQECVKVRTIREMKMDMEHDWVRSGRAQKGKDDVFICKRCGWQGVRKPGMIQINALSKYSHTPNVCNWDIV